MGDYDYLPDVIVRLGGEVLFHKARVKPGKPVLIARLRDTWIASLPGNPVSVAASYHLYVRRIAAGLMGQPHSPRRNMAVLQSDVSVGGSRYYLLGAHLEETSDGVFATPVTRQDSGRLGSIRNINGFVMLDVDTRVLSKGDRVPVEWIY